MIERMLCDFDAAYGLRSVSLRYFNAAGADPDGDVGEVHDPEPHLIPHILDVAAGKRRYLEVYGDDYDTPDRCLELALYVSLRIFFMGTALHYRLLKLIEERPEISQHKIAHELDLGLGKTNYCPKAFINRVQVRVNNFRRSDNKLVFACPGFAGGWVT